MLPAVPSQATAGAPSAVEARGITRISGDHSGYTVVSVPKRAEVDIRVHSRNPRGPNPGVRVTGGGAFAGFMLTTAPPSDANVRAIVVGGRFHSCTPEWCDLQPMNYMEPSADFGRGPRTHVLRPGTYRLYLVTEGEEASVTLRLRGLGGRVDMQPQVAAGADMKPLETSLSIEQGQSVAAAGNEYRLGASGVVLMNLVMEAQDFRGVELGACLYSVVTAPPPKAAYGPHCNAVMELGLAGGYSMSVPPPGSGTYGNMSARITALFEYREGVIANLDDRHAAGLWYASTGQIDRAAAQFVYVTF